MNTPKSVGLALGGGGLWGLSHIGVADELQKEGVPINAIAGASMGAVIGGVLAKHINEQGNITREGVDRLLQIAGSIESLDQLTTRKDGKIVLALDEIMNNAGADVRDAITGGRTKVPYAAQVSSINSHSTSNRVFLSSPVGQPWQELEQRMRASAALKPKFGMDPVTINGETFADDTSVAYRSTHDATKYLRERGVQKVIGVPVGFIDGRLFKPVQKILHWLHPNLRDRGDVVIEPKKGHDAIDGSNALTNFGKGWMGMWQKFARTKDDLTRAKRIPIPTEEFIEAGRQQAQAHMPEIDRLLGRK
jgi:predicted acylesterase/phospholipase RssA